MKFVKADKTICLSEYMYLVLTGNGCQIPDEVDRLFCFLYIDHDLFEMFYLFLFMVKLLSGSIIDVKI